MSAAPSGPFPVAVPARQVRAEQQRRYSGLHGTGSQPALPAAPARWPSGPQQQAPQGGTGPQPTFSERLPQRQPQQPRTDPVAWHMHQMPPGAFTADRRSLWRTLRGLRRLDLRTLGNAQRRGTPYAAALALEEPVFEALAREFRPAPPAGQAWQARQRLMSLNYPRAGVNATAREYRNLFLEADRITGTRGPQLHPMPGLPAAPQEGSLRRFLGRRIRDEVIWHGTVSCAADARERTDALAALHDAVLSAASDAEALAIAGAAVKDGTARPEILGDMRGAA